jgi:hypothetical protein
MERSNWMSDEGYASALAAEMRRPVDNLQSRGVVETVVQVAVGTLVVSLVFAAIWALGGIPVLLMPQEWRPGEINEPVLRIGLRIFNGILLTLATSLAILIVGTVLELLRIAGDFVLELLGIPLTAMASKQKLWRTSPDTDLAPASASDPDRSRVQEGATKATEEWR